MVNSVIRRDARHIPGEKYNRLNISGANVNNLFAHLFSPKMKEEGNAITKANIIL